MKCEHCGEEKTNVRGQKFDRWMNELYLCIDCSDWLYSYIINEVLQNLNINEEEEEEPEQCFICKHKRRARLRTA